MVHFPLMFLSEWREFHSAPCLAGKKKVTARVSKLLKSRASPDVFPFRFCNKKNLQYGTWIEPSFQRHYRFRPKTSGNKSVQGLISTPHIYKSWPNKHFVCCVMCSRACRQNWNEPFLKLYFLSQNKREIKLSSVKCVCVLSGTKQQSNGIEYSCTHRLIKWPSCIRKQRFNSNNRGKNLRWKFFCSQSYNPELWEQRIFLFICLN